MKGKDESAMDDEWRVLEQKIKTFQENVKSFQRDIENKLKKGDAENPKR